ncbi:ABC transporter ATP-binding protein/permease [Acinetobacter pittii]|uniref:ABC transporter ATP-binding protein/permease n=1 Tax=Acinetobacter calcoaceticus/baumannii complex TaxID=909768 RepID=UPI00092AA455|nr:ABC transporter ATP-binding protein/permease [Acinetobacter baumannii]OJK06340.1 ABC transporter [Acinetobacter baumannii]
MNAKIRPNIRPSILQLILPYWLNKENWKGWILLALKIVLIFTTVYIAVWANELDGQVVDAMVKRQWNGLWQVLLIALGAGLLHVIISLFSTYLIGESQQYQWRSWMTKWLIEKWTRHCAFYSIERDASVDNADQRIAQDVERFVQLTLTLTLSTLQVVVSTVSFTIVLWHLSGTLQFSAWGYDFSITGYMVYIAYLYAIGSLLISHFTGKQLIGLFNDKQTVEANFRYQGMQLRENAEQVAFYDGGQRECQRLVAYFDDVKGNWRAIIVRTCKMMLARDVYVQTGSILPTAAALPRYLSGAISLGDVTRITGAFGSVTSSLSFFTQAYVGFAEWKAVSNRLRDLIGAVEQNQHEAESAKISLNHSDKDEIYTSSLNLTRPNGEIISQSPEIHIRHGERWLIQGKSGAGKSTLLRAIAGIWPYGQGEIHLPERHKLMFLPQRSYIPTGTLQAALCYPNQHQYFDHDQCAEILKTVHLEHLIEKLDTEDRWQQKLSGGEQQRLAFARALLQQPDFLFLDEATSAIDPETEQSLYQAVLATLPHAAIISVAHRESLTQYHDHILNLNRSEK